MGITINNKFNKLTKITMMCPKCFNKQEYDVNIEIPKNKKFTLSIEPFHCRCEKCGITMVSVDEAIIDDIIALNKAGYKTKYCCSGHENGSNLYVYFKDKKFYKDMKKFKIEVPEFLMLEIEITKSDYKFVIRGNLSMATTNDEFDNFLQRVRIDLHSLITEVLANKRTSQR